MTKIKQHKLRQLDNDLLIYQEQADLVGLDIESCPEYIELCALVTAYQWGERRHSKRMMEEYGALAQKVTAFIKGAA